MEVGIAARVSVLRLEDSAGPETHVLVDGESVIIHSIVIDSEGGIATVEMQTAAGETLAIWQAPFTGSRLVQVINFPFLADKGLQFIIENSSGVPGTSTDVVVFHSNPGR